MDWPINKLEPEISNIHNHCLKTNGSVTCPFHLLCHHLCSQSFKNEEVSRDVSEPT